MAKSFSKTRLVALIVDASRPYHRKMIPGVAQYANEAGNWRLYLEEDANERLPDFRSWRGNGILTTFETRSVVQAVAKLRIPVVGLERTGWTEGTSHIPGVGTDNAAVGRLGAEYLCNRGCMRLAYCGFPRSRLTSYSQLRADAFRNVAEQAGRDCSTYTGRHLLSRKWRDLQRGITDWLGGLEMPLGLMAANDNRARHVLEACRAMGLRVPEDVAVIGVDNDEIVCEVTQPPLTSIEQDAKQIGYQAAATLDQMMDRRRPQEMDVHVPPVGVVERRSTDVLAVEDQDVAAALEFIRDHVADGIQITDLVERLQLSRSTLDAKFKAAMGRTLHAEIRRVQLQRAKDLIAGSNLPLKLVALRSGFAHAQHMSNVFRQSVGLTPGQYRHRFRH